MLVVNLDFETRSTVDLKKSGVYPYAEHADTGVLIVGSHFPPPGAGYLVTTDTGVRFQPAAA